jgi:endonuclease III
LAASVPDILEQLEAHYGARKTSWPTEPYAFLIWWHCGYPASDAACQRGWDSLKKSVGIDPESILAASSEKLTRALAPGGMVPERRAERLKQIAARIVDEFGGDLRGRLVGPLAHTRKLLKSFPNIADPGADRILLFAGISPIAAVPSNCPHVLVRIALGRERESYSVTYREAQRLIEETVPENIAARGRAYLLIKHHGQELCKRTNPGCDRCPVNSSCAMFAGKSRGRAAR